VEYYWLGAARIEKKQVIALDWIPIPGRIVQGAPSVWSECCNLLWSWWRWHCSVWWGGRWLCVLLGADLRINNSEGGVWRREGREEGSLFFPSPFAFPAPKTYFLSRLPRKGDDQLHTNLPSQLPYYSGDEVEDDQLRISNPHQYQPPPLSFSVEKRRRKRWCRGIEQSWIFFL